MMARRVEAAPTRGPLVADATESLSIGAYTLRRIALIEVISRSEGSKSWAGKEEIAIWKFGTFWPSSASPRLLSKSVR
jgi:hypothetical protein